MNRIIRMKEDSLTEARKHRVSIQGRAMRPQKARPFLIPTLFVYPAFGLVNFATFVVNESSLCDRFTLARDFFPSVSIGVYPWLSCFVWLRRCRAMCIRGNPIFHSFSMCPSVFSVRGQILNLWVLTILTPGLALCSLRSMPSAWQAAAWIRHSSILTSEF